MQRQSKTPTRNALINAKSRDLQRIIDIYMFNNSRLKRGAFIESRPLVKRGDKVSKSQLLADTNQTLGGKLALGVNLTTAVMPYKGETHEDGVVILSSAIQRRTHCRLPSKCH